MGAYNQQAYRYVNDFLLDSVTWDEIIKAALELESGSDDGVTRTGRPKRNTKRNTFKNLNIEELDRNLLVQHAGTVGIGAWAARAFVKDECIGIYMGTIINKTEKESRLKEKTDQYSFYTFELVKDKYYIDGYHAGNKTRFMNHSHIVNVEVRRIWMDNKPVLGFFSTREIEKHEELLYNYGHSEDMFICECRHYECVKKRQAKKTLEEFSCEKCGKKYTSKKAFDFHVDSHTKPHKCSKCPQRFSQLGHLNRHFRNQHNSAMPKKKTKQGGVKHTKKSLEKLSTMLKASTTEGEEVTGDPQMESSHNANEMVVDSSGVTDTVHRPDYINERGEEEGGEEEGGEDFGETEIAAVGVGMNVLSAQIVTVNASEKIQLIDNVMDSDEEGDMQNKGRNSRTRKKRDKYYNDDDYVPLSKQHRKK